MYNILIVDDEPLICQGLSSLLQTSGLAIGQLHTALSGQEALDYLRMEDIDLLITDIQMGAMSGIELMHQAKIQKPWVQTIVISAHEKFQYAQLAMRLGARDYLIKPLKNEQFVHAVRSVLLQMERPAQAEGDYLSVQRERYRMQEPQRELGLLRNRLLTEPGATPEQAAAAGVTGPYFAVIRMRLMPDEPRSDEDMRLLQYAALNIAGELLGQDWRYVSCYCPDGEVAIILQWDEAAYGESSDAEKLNQLDMIGRSLHYNMHKYLHLACIVGISQILRGIEFLHNLGDQARSAILWHRQHPDHFVFYYGDLKWSALSEEQGESAQTNRIVETVKAYIDRHYARKGLTLHEVAHENHVSPNYLSYLFKKYTGLNLWEYVIQLRMEESRKLLLSTDMRRYEIADKVGYESPEHFSKIFKKYFGISPSEVKRQAP